MPAVKDTLDIINKSFTMPRKLHKRGHSTHIRGKVCVPCAVNRDGVSISKITNTGRVSTKRFTLYL